MDKTDVRELHVITHIKNVPSITKLGIFSRNMAKRKNIKYIDISEEGVQDIRAGKKIPGTKKELHDYSNLYFDAHNPMLSARRSRNNEICVLRVSPDVLDLSGVIVTDRNAARGCWFKTASKGLPLLDKNVIFATFWIYRNPPDPIKEYWHGGAKCAEVLVPNCVHPIYIVGAYVANAVALSKFKDISNLSVRISSMFF